MVEQHLFLWFVMAFSGLVAAGGPGGYLSPYTQGGNMTTTVRCGPNLDQKS